MHTTNKEHKKSRHSQAWQLQNWQKTVQTSLTRMTLSDQSHAAEERENLQSLAPDSVVSTILRIQTRLAIKACDDSKKMFFFPPGRVHSLLSLSSTSPRPPPSWHAQSPIVAHF